MTTTGAGGGARAPSPWNEVEAWLLSAARVSCGKVEKNGRDARDERARRSTWSGRTIFSSVAVGLRVSLSKEATRSSAADLKWDGGR